MKVETQNLERFANQIGYIKTRLPIERVTKIRESHGTENFHNYYKLNLIILTNNS